LEEVVLNIIRKSLPLVAAILLAACASTPKADLAAEPGKPATARHVVNQEYVRAVERASRISGTEVIWVNPPMKIDRDD